MDTILGEIVKKAEKFKEAMFFADPAFRQIREFEIASGIASETADVVTKSAKERKAMQESLVISLGDEIKARERINKLLQGGNALTRMRTKEQLENIATDTFEFGGSTVKPWEEEGALGPSAARNKLAADFMTPEFADPDKGLAHLVAVEGSAEYKGLMNVMKSGIPEMVDFVRKEMKGFMTNEFKDSLTSVSYTHLTLPTKA